MDIHREIRGRGRPANADAARRARLRWAGEGVLVVMAGIALLTSGCGGGSSSSPGSSAGGGSATSSSQGNAIAYAQCMRTHGVPNFPDPGGNPNGINPSSPAVQAANKDCQYLMPNGGHVSQAQQQQATTGLLKFAGCMRSHGVPNFPDPSSGSSGTGIQVPGLNTSSPQFKAAMGHCQSLLGHGGQQNQQVP